MITTSESRALSLRQAHAEWLERERARDAAGEHHTHDCPDCGYAWSHGPDNHANRDTHICPSCGYGPVWGRRGEERFFQR